MPPDEVEEKAKPEIKASYCSHDAQGLDYSLDIEVHDRHVTLDIFSWDHMPGHEAKIVIYELTVEEIKKLGEAILETAFRIRALSEKKVKDTK
jgi:hypothetical protein